MMSRHPAASQEASKEDGDDLTTILNHSQRTDLTLLIAVITDSMRNLILQNFDPEAGLAKSFSRKGMSDEEKFLSTDPKSVNVEEMDRQKQLRQEYEKDISSMKMKNIKNGSLKAFDDWREQVLMRVGQVVNSKDTAKTSLEKNTDTSTEAKPETPAPIGKIIEAPNKGNNLKFKDLYPPTKTTLTKLSMEQRTLVLHSVLLLVLSLKHYNALSRVLLLLLTSSLKLPLKTFEQDEYVTAKGLLESVKEMTAAEETKKKVEDNKESRKWKVGLATAAGAAIMGVTGGLAAPLVAAGVGSVMGGLGLGATSAAAYLGSVAGSTYLVGGLFGAYGGRMTGKMMGSYAKDVDDFEFLPVHSNKKTSEDEKEGAKQASDHDHKLRVSICISGWLTEKEEVLKPWRVLGTGAEVFALKYELEAMLNLGNAMNGFVQSTAWGYAQQQMIAQTIFADLAASMWPIALLKAARVIDNPFNVAKTRSEKAGEVLADALINKAQGERPVTLIGYSLGARVIYSCLMSLARRKAFGLIENVVLVGAPTPSDTSDWRMLRSVVVGRLINVYSQNDYILGFMYRTSSLQYGVAGLQAVEGLPGVENVDVSDEVNGHLRYRYLIGSVLKKIGFEDVDMQAVEDEKEALMRMEEEEEKNSLDAQRKRMLRRQNSGGKEDESAEVDQEASEIEKEVQAKTQKSLFTRGIEYFYAAGTMDSQSTPGTKEDAQSSTGTAVPKTGKDEQTSDQSLAQRAYSILPSLPNLGRSSPDQEEREAAGQSHVQQSDDSPQPQEGYASEAAGYLPSMPKSLPSIPGLSGRRQAQQQTRKTTKKGSAAGETSDASRQKATNVENNADEGSRPITENTNSSKTGQSRDSGKSLPSTVPASQQLQRRSSSQQATKAAPGSGKSSQLTAARRSDADNERTEKGERTDDGASTNTPKGKAKSNQSYVSYAASYLPSIPQSIPSMPSVPGFSSTRKAAPKLERRDSPSIRSPPPKLDRRRSSQVRSPPADVEEKAASRIRSPPPKLAPRRTDSSVRTAS